MRYFSISKDCSDINSLISEWLVVNIITSCKLLLILSKPNTNLALLAGFKNIEKLS